MGTLCARQQWLLFRLLLRNWAYAITSGVAEAIALGVSMMNHCYSILRSKARSGLCLFLFLSSWLSIPIILRLKYTLRPLLNKTPNSTSKEKLLKSPTVGLEDGLAGKVPGSKTGYLNSLGPWGGGEREKQLLQVFLWLPHMCDMHAHTHWHTHT